MSESTNIFAYKKLMLMLMNMIQTNISEYIQIYLKIRILATPQVGYIFNTPGRHLAVPNEKKLRTLSGRQKVSRMKRLLIRFFENWRGCCINLFPISCSQNFPLNGKVVSGSGDSSQLITAIMNLFELRVYLDFCQPLHCSEIVFALAQHNIN